MAGTTSGNPSVPTRTERLQYRDIVTIYVGPKPHKFELHESILTKYSKFFRAALSGNFGEAQQKTVRLPEVNVTAFETYVQWMYSGEIVLDIDMDIEREDWLVQRYTQLSTLYVVADQLENLRLRNETMTALVQFTIETGRCAVVKLIAYAYTQSHEKSTLRRFTLDSYFISVAAGDSSWLEDNRKLLPEDFVFDVACAAITRAKDSEATDPTTQHRCYYHEHNDDDRPCE